MGKQSGISSRIRLDFDWGFEMGSRDQRDILKTLGLG